MLLAVLVSFQPRKLEGRHAAIIMVVNYHTPPKGVSTLSWWWGLRDSVTYRAMPAVV